MAPRIQKADTEASRLGLVCHSAKEVLNRPPTSKPLTGHTGLEQVVGRLSDPEERPNLLPSRNRAESRNFGHGFR